MSKGGSTLRFRSNKIGVQNAPSMDLIFRLKIGSEFGHRFLNRGGMLSFGF